MATGHGVDDPCFVLTDNPGLVLNEGEVDTAPTQPAFQGRELMIRYWAGRYAWQTFVHPCRVKSFQKAVSTVTDNLGKDDKIIE